MFLINFDSYNKL